MLPGSAWRHHFPPRFEAFDLGLAARTPPMTHPMSGFPVRLRRPQVRRARSRSGLGLLPRFGSCRGQRRRCPDRTGSSHPEQTEMPRTTAHVRQRASASLAAINAHIGATGHRSYVAIFEPDRESRASRGDVDVARAESLRKNGPACGDRSHIGSCGHSRHRRRCLADANRRWALVQELNVILRACGGPLIEKLDILSRVRLFRRGRCFVERFDVSCRRPRQPARSAGPLPAAPTS